MKNISKEDYIIWDNVLNKPCESLDIVYHYTSLVELINDNFKLGKTESFVCVAELPLEWQKKINDAIEITKNFDNVKSIFDYATSFYDIADFLEEEGEQDKATDMRIKLSVICGFLVNNFNEEFRLK